MHALTWGCHSRPCQHSFAKAKLKKFVHHGGCLPKTWITNTNKQRQSVRLSPRPCPDLKNPPSSGLMWQESSNPYGASSSHAQYYAQPPQSGPSQPVPLQFFAPPTSTDRNTFYPGSRSSLEGNVGAQGPISQHAVPPGYGGNIQPAGGWWTAFGTGGFEGEPPLLEGEAAVSTITEPL